MKKTQKLLQGYCGNDEEDPEIDEGDTTMMKKTQKLMRETQQ